MPYTPTKGSRFSPQDSPINDDLSRRTLEKRRKHLKRRRIRNYDNKLFISLPSMQEFWESEYPLKIFLVEVSIDISSDKLELICTTSLRILTALVLTEWQAKNAVRNFCATFQRIFLDEANPSWNDEMLLGPDGLPDLELPRLSRDEKDSLDNAIFEVSVPVLQKSKERKSYSPNIILPVTSVKSRENLLGKGGYGEVYKAQIAAGCLLIENKASDRIEVNKADETFAWKIMDSVAGEQTELNFARDYYKVTRTSKFILDHLAIMEVDGKHASILYPLAQGDLQALLDGSLECKEWSMDDPEIFHKIIKKCNLLADGLEFLHNDLKDEGECFCRHGDLKPNNFLVFDEEWKISDMGLAKIKKHPNSEPGVRITTKTSRAPGCAAYAAPEMDADEVYVGRATDVWALAAIMMEIIIWGFGGPNAYTEFRNQRNEHSKGWFYESNVLSKAVDDELASWSEKHIEAVARCLQGDQDPRDSAQRLLDGLVVGLRKALTIEAENRAKSRDLLDTFQNIMKYFNDPKSVDVGRQSLKQLAINEPSATVALTVMLNQHTDHDFFRTSFKPRECICVSRDTEFEIKKWITSPTPTAIAIDTHGQNQRFPISSITHEIYYTARRAEYTVVKFLTLDRYSYHSPPLKPSLDLVYCFIQQFAVCWGVKEYDADGLAMHDPAVSDETRLKSAITLLGSLIQTYGQDRNAKPLIIIIDEFWRICPRGVSETANDQWRSLLAILGCGRIQERKVTNAASFPKSPHLKILIRVRGYPDSLRDLGFDGKIDRSPAIKQSGQPLRRVVDSSLKIYEEKA